MTLKGSNNEARIWNYCIARGLTEAGAAGLMGNLYAESALNPKNLQNSYEKKLGHTDESYTAAVDNGTYGNFVRDRAGYGLAQWTYWSRKEALLAFARSKGRSIGDLEMQLDFCFKELSSGYKAVLNTLKTATTVRAASDSVLLKFERPADMSEAAQKRRASYGQKYFDKYAVAGKDTKKEENKVGKMTSAAFVEKLIDVAKNYKTLYVMGCFGAPMSAANKKRYTSNHTYNKQAARTRMINAASADTFGFDCVCLIKGILWGWRGDTVKSYGGASYAVNGVPDIGADQMITKCAGVSTDFSNVAVGEALWCEGHIGVYIGNGLGVECTPRWDNKVQITAVANIGKKAGYNARTWRKHGKLPYIDYTGAQTDASGGTAEGKKDNAVAGYAVGDIVEFIGTKHYTSANASSGKPCKAGKAKITQIYKSGKHQYHLVKVSGGGSTVYGWVDAQDISGGTSAQKIMAGSKVRVKAGAKTYSGGSLASFVYSRDHIVKELSGKRAVITYGGTVVAAVNVDDLTLI